MLDCKEIKYFIEKKHNVELTPIQYRILKAIVRGNIIYTARGIGRTFLYNGYAEYLKEVVAKNTGINKTEEDFDSIFTANMLMQDKIFYNNKVQAVWDNIKISNEELFARDFECKFLNKENKNE